MLSPTPLPAAPTAEAAEAVRRSEERFRALIEDCADVVILVDSDYRITYATPSAEVVTGHALADLVGQVCLEFTHPDDLPAKRAALDECQRHPDWAVPFRARYRHADGSWRAYEGMARNRLADPAVGALVINFRDVAERVAVEDALRTGEARYRALVENVPVAIWEEDFTGVAAWFDELRAAGVTDLRVHLATSPVALDRALGLIRIRDVNRAAIRQNRAANKAELIAHLPRLFTPAGRVAFAEELVDLWDGKTELEYESRAKRLDGHLIDLLVNVVVADGDDGRPDWSRVIVTGTDITDRRRAEAALAAQNTLLQSVLDAIPDLIVRKDAAGLVCGCNRAFAAFVGRAESDVLGRTCYDLLPREVADITEEADEAVMAGGPAQRLEMWCPAPDGRAVLIETLRVPVPGPDGRPSGILGISRDITQRRQLEDQLRQAGKLEAVGQLAGGIAHDFNNLLTVLTGNLTLLGGELSADHSGRANLTACEQAAARAAELTRQLLGFARRSPITLRPVNLNGVVAETVAILRRTIDPRVEIDVRPTADLGTALADYGQMIQVLLNLCLNARDAMPEGGTLRIETANASVDDAHARRVVTAHAGRFVRLRVADTGAGIPLEVRDRLFEPFFTTKEPGHGTGLGLAMVHGIVQQHGGWVEVDSEPGGGARFDVYLPRADRAATRPPAPAALTPEPAGGTETVLLVDDEALIRDLGQAVLERQGYRVLLAKDGVEAVERYVQEGAAIDLVILDLTMPRLSGRDTLRRLRELNPRVRVLLSSGYSADYSPTVAETGVCGFVGKPYRAMDLAAAVRAALDG